MVFAKVLHLKILLLSCLNVTYMSRWHYPAEDDGVWLSVALATGARKGRRKLPETLCRLERHQSRNQSVTLSICCMTVIANNDSIYTTDKMTHLVCSNDVSRLTMLLNTYMKQVFKTHFQMITLYMCIRPEFKRQCLHRLFPKVHAYSTCIG